MKTMRLKNGKRGAGKKRQLLSPVPALKPGWRMTEQRDDKSEPVAADGEAEHVVSTRHELPQAPALQLYLREIGQVKLLTPKEEVALARRIKRGDAQAREHMIKAN